MFFPTWSAETLATESQVSLLNAESWTSLPTYQIRISKGEAWELNYLTNLSMIMPSKV